MGYEKVTEAPKDLKILIDAFNALPDDDAKVEAALNEVSLRYNGEFQATVEAKQYEKVPDVGEKYLKQLRKFLPKEAFSTLEHPGFLNAVFGIRRLLIERQVIKQLVYNFWERNEGGFHLKGLGPLTFADDGTVVPVGRVLTLFSKISIERVRICQICDTIFWAKKSNAWSCSPGCATSLGNYKRLAKEKAAREKR
ncbi:hypothetical protein BH18ACI3_BH18ACI3_06900 [soil metagenome]